MATLETGNFDYQNFFQAKLTADLTSGGTDIFLDNVPTISEGTLVIDPNSTNPEIIYFNSKTSVKVTCPAGGRGYDGTTANSHNSGTTVIMAPIADWFRALKNGSAYDSLAGTGWLTTGETWNTSANNGNKEYVFTISGDKSGKYTPGMRFKGIPTATAPTQCMAFIGSSSQTAAKSTPTGITFTGNFTVEKWIYLTSYPSGDASAIGRDNTGGGGSGWELDIKATGQVQLFWRNASGTSAGSTWQSLPLNKWVHIAAVATVATPTVAFYINGTLVASAMTATTATSVVQPTANLQMGRGNANTAYLSYYSSETRVWSVAQTQANIQANMRKSLLGSETNLVFLVQGNGTFVDKTANANTLTAANGTIATQAANPYNAIEYGIITKVSYDGSSTTTVTVFFGTDYNAPSDGFSATYWSMQSKPFGFLSQASKWALVFPINSGQTKNTSLARWILQNPNGINFQLPTGSWRIKGQLLGLITTTVSQAFNDINMMLSTSTSVDITNSSPFNKLFARFDLQASTTEVDGPMFYVEDNVDVSSMTPYYVLIGTSAANIGQLTISGNTNVTFECAYL